MRSPKCAALLALLLPLALCAPLPPTSTETVYTIERRAPARGDKVGHLFGTAADTLQDVGKSLFGTVAKGAGDILGGQPLVAIGTLLNGVGDTLEKTVDGLTDTTAQLAKLTGGKPP